MAKVLSVSAGYFAEVDVVTATRGTAIVDFGTGGAVEARVVVAQPSILSTSVALADVQVRASADHTADEHLIEEMYVRAGSIVQGVGFTIYARSRNRRLFGKFNLGWVWS